MDARHKALIETPFYTTEGLMDARHKALIETPFYNTE